MRKVVYFDEYEKKKRLEKIIVKVSFKAVVIITGLFLIVLFNLFKYKYDEISELKRIYSAKEKEVNVLKQKVEFLEKKIEELNSPIGIEKIAREKLNMVKKGEKVLIPVVKTKK